MQSVGILEDNIALRQSIEDYLFASGNYTILFSEGSYSAVKHNKYPQCPDFLLLDVHITDGSVLDIISDLQTQFYNSKIIIMTGDDNDFLLLKAIENGASSFICKPIVMNDLIKTIDQLTKTGSYLEPELLTKLMWMINQKNISNVNYSNVKLTNREREILALVEQGMTYKEISSKLYITFFTVNHHLKNIYTKFNVNSKIELITKLNK
ncbi:MAG: response regulator transcription factor [Bacteroidota bacterium]